MAQFIENLKGYFKSINDHRILKKCGDRWKLAEATDEEKIRWFELVGNAERKEALVNGSLGHVLDALFPKYANVVAPYMTLSDEQFQVILGEGYFEALQGYVTKHTLRVNCLMAFIEATVERAGVQAVAPISLEAKRLPDLLRSYIIREGLPVSLIPFVLGYPLEKMGDIKELIMNATSINYHVFAVKNGISNGEITETFAIYLRWLKSEKITMPDEAAVMMKEKQVIAFHHEGLHLSKKAIVSLLGNDDGSLISYSIFDNEVVYPMWPELEAVLQAKPGIYRFYQSRLLLGKLKKANS